MEESHVIVMFENKASKELSIETISDVTPSSCQDTNENSDEEQRIEICDSTTSEYNQETMIMTSNNKNENHVINVNGSPFQEGIIMQDCDLHMESVETAIYEKFTQKQFIRRKTSITSQCKLVKVTYNISKVTNVSKTVCKTQKIYRNYICTCTEIATSLSDKRDGSRIVA